MHSVHCGAVATVKIVGVA